MLSNLLNSFENVKCLEDAKEILINLKENDIEFCEADNEKIFDMMDLNEEDTQELVNFLEEIDEDNDDELIDVNDATLRNKKLGSAFGNLKASINDYPLLSIDEEKTLLKRYKEENDEEAKNTIILSNMRLVIKIATKFTNRGLDFDDLIMEGTIGMMKALERFECEKGFKFSTYATWWIRQAIGRAIQNKGRCIRVPVYIHTKLKTIKNAEKELIQILDRAPTIEEIAEETEMSVLEVTELFSLGLPISSIDMTIKDDEQNTFEQNVAIDKEQETASLVENQVLNECLSGLLSQYLTIREEEVVKSRYGLINGKTKTLEEIAKEFDLTKERIRQIERTAINKLKSQPKVLEQLHEFLIA